MNPLINLWLSNARGEPAVVHSKTSPPPHLQNATWKFSCACGYSWKLEGADAERRDQQWRGPLRECTGCHRALEGRQTP